MKHYISLIVTIALVCMFAPAYAAECPCADGSPLQSSGGGLVLYLNDNLSANSALDVGSDFDYGKVTKLCLHGYELSLKQINIYPDSTLELYDCVGGGKLVGSYGSYIPTVSIGTNGTLKMYGGTIVDNDNVAVKNNGGSFIFVNGDVEGTTSHVQGNYTVPEGSEIIRLTDNLISVRIKNPVFNAESDLPQTGDHSNLTLWILLLTATLTITVVFHKRYAHH